jgi:hypothetical protein
MSKGLRKDAAPQVFRDERFAEGQKVGSAAYDCTFGRRLVCAGEAPIRHRSGPASARPMMVFAAVTSAACLRSGRSA